ncbi:murein L,D-transpeptidase catalytic domain family protein [Sphingomonas aracearum]|uniref:Twin-arginine translocation pathway signal protein n=1 Tax=Sphingomonas aracearum TaxID=2283317 RepID=A0A369VV78_9SPHN|nr:murein L,D-transpeptidase catalytic domain family protein [Sphingomonas aracearum]RDE05555.1 twin-arginine translocation pathway signal protein [Sphingomonas aracearum]
MNDLLGRGASRRALLKGSALIAGGMMLPEGAGATMMAPAPAAPLPLMPRGLRPELLRRALGALNTHGTVKQRDRMAVVDFALPSSQPRFHLVDLASGATTSFLVAHGSGSDPAHTGWVQRFSNAFNSNASCDGAFLAADYYVGKHGRSQRLIGLDGSNNNALGRAIVVHSAWYANPDLAKTRGMLGRSQGCFAVGERQLAEVFERLGPGRMIYAAKI